MIKRMKPLKCTVHIDYDIPYDFKDIIEKAYEYIINTLRGELDYRGYDHDVVPDYFTNNSIVLYCPNNPDDWRNCVKEIFDSDTLKNIKVKEEEKFIDTIVESYSAEYYLEFSYSDNYHIR